MATTVGLTFDGEEPEAPAEEVEAPNEEEPTEAVPTDEDEAPAEGGLLGRLRK